MSLDELTTQVELGTYTNAMFLSEEARNTKLRYYPTPSSYVCQRRIHSRLSNEDVVDMAKEEGNIVVNVGRTEWNPLNPEEGRIKDLYHFIAIISNQIVYVVDKNDNNILESDYMGNHTIRTQSYYLLSCRNSMPELIRSLNYSATVMAVVLNKTRTDYMRFTKEIIDVYETIKDKLLFRSNVQVKDVVGFSKYIQSI